MGQKETAYSALGVGHGVGAPGVGVGGVAVGCAVPLPPTTMGR
ncbi:MAG: hypothetical protein OCU12_06375 [Methanophagales archaeon]|nr:hypothetical protein [Methanophagales archaeon]